MSAASPTRPGRIFISYRRQDTAYPAGWLYDRLSERLGSTQIFKDVDNLEPGDDFLEKIQLAVSSCDVLLALIGPEWETITDEHGRRRLEDHADFVRFEIEVALSRKVKVIPLLVGKATMPRAESLPPTLAPLIRRQALELTPGHFNRDADELVSVLEKALAEVVRDDPLPATTVMPAVPPAERAAAPVVDVAPPAPVSTSQEPAGGATDPAPDVSPPSWWDVAATEPSTAGRAPSTAPRGRPVPQRRRHRRRIVALLVALVVVAGTAAALLGVRLTRTVDLPVAAAPLPDDVMVGRHQRGGVRSIATIPLHGGPGLTFSDNKDDDSVVISPDRRTVIYRRSLDLDPRVKGNDAAELRVVSADGHGDRLLVPAAPDCFPLSRPAWTRDARGVDLLAVVCGDGSNPRSELRLIRLDGALVRVLDTGKLGDPAFSKDGATVVYWKNRTKGKGDGGALFGAAADGNTGPVQLTEGGDGTDADPVCSPGGLVAFRHAKDGHKSIQTVPLGFRADGSVVSLTQGPQDQDPSWSPDGTQLVFRRGPDDDARLQMMDANGSNVRPVGDDLGPDGATVWGTR